MRTILEILTLFLIIHWIGCGKINKESDQVYFNQINRWQQERVERLTSATGWMSLAGLFWLKEGENTFGADSSNDIVFPAGKATGFMGSFILKDSVVTAKVLPQIKILQDGKPLTTAIMKSDADGDPTVLTYGSLSWYIIKRSNDFAVRLRDSKNPHIQSFHGIARYPIDPSWRLEATFESYDPPKSVSVPTILGTIDEEHSPGALVFKIRNRTYRLDVIGKPDDDEFFVIFGDETNKDETYPGGRYIYVDNPKGKGKTILDFNKAYNPPCAFTEFATCPFPPDQNKLSLKIKAGEKRYH